MVIIRLLSSLPLHRRSSQVNNQLFLVSVLETYPPLSDTSLLREVSGEKEVDRCFVLFLLLLLFFVRAAHHKTSTFPLSH